MNWVAFYFVGHCVGSNGWSDLKIIIIITLSQRGAALVVQMIKNPPAVQETWFDSWVRRSPGEGNGHPLQYSCLENSMDRGAWWATVHEVTQSQTQLSDYSYYTTEYYSTIKKKSWNLAIWNNMDRPTGYHAKWNKSDGKRHYIVLLTCGI